MSLCSTCRMKTEIQSKAFIKCPTYRSAAHWATQSKVTDVVKSALTAFVHIPTCCNGKTPFQGLLTTPGFPLDAESWEQHQCLSHGGRWKPPWGGTWCLQHPHSLPFSCRDPPQWHHYVGKPTVENGNSFIKMSCSSVTELSLHLSAYTLCEPWIFVSILHFCRKIISSVDSR